MRLAFLPVVGVLRQGNLAASIPADELVGASSARIAQEIQSEFFESCRRNDVTSGRCRHVAEERAGCRELDRDGLLVGLFDHGPWTVVHPGEWTSNFWISDPR